MTLNKLLRAIHPNAAISELLFDLSPNILIHKNIIPATNNPALAIIRSVFIVLLSIIDPPFKFLRQYISPFNISSYDIFIMYHVPIYLSTSYSILKLQYK